MKANLIGTYTEEEESSGIYSCRIDPSTGHIEKHCSTSIGENPVFQASHPDGEHLYSVDMVDKGVVRTFSIDTETGELSQVDSRPTGDSGP